VVAKKKTHVYFPAETAEELLAESTRVDRPVSWLVERAWELAKSEITNMPVDGSKEQK
jgi:uncharacterized small protein (TIGR04563 family)